MFFLKKKIAFFQKSLCFLEKKMASNTEPTTIDFTEKHFEEKRKIVLEIILKMMNYNDISARTLDWSTPTMLLFVNPSMVLSFIQTFERICGQLTVEKTAEEIFKIVLNFE